jgi:hypothetical protein
MGNYVIGTLGNYVIEKRSDLGNFMIADSRWPLMLRTGWVVVRRTCW